MFDETEFAVRCGTYAFGKLVGIAAITAYVDVAESAQDIAQEMMGWFWYLDDPIAPEDEPKFDDETLDAITAFRRFLEEIAYAPSAPVEDTTLYESHDSMPWNRNGSDDAEALWQAQNESDDAYIDFLVERQERDREF